ncbi:MAG: Mur ligase family protein [Candidatus Nealsonbacteria bacterium]|nr:Mur ligase family protein [Candidatus Nealsonbacteria bacterium]
MIDKFLNKIKFLLRRPKVVIITGRGKETAAQAIKQVLASSFKINKDVLIFQTDLEEDFSFLIKKSRKAVLVATHVGQYHQEKEFFSAEEKEVSNIKKLAEALPERANLILNFDDEAIRNLKNVSKARVLTFGLAVRADLRATDIVLLRSPASGTNFKINFQGSIVPVWLEGLFGKEHVYAALSAVAVGEILGLNLVEISSALREYQGGLTNSQNHDS